MRKAQEYKSGFPYRPNISTSSTVLSVERPDAHTTPLPDHQSIEAVKGNNVKLFCGLKRTGTMEKRLPLRKGMCCEQPLHAFAWKFSQEGRHQLHERELFSLNVGLPNTAQRFSPKDVMLKEPSA